MLWRTTVFDDFAPGTINIKTGVVTYPDGFQIDLEFIKLLLTPPAGTKLIRPDGSGVEWIGYEKGSDRLAIKAILRSFDKEHV